MKAKDVLQNTHENAIAAKETLSKLLDYLDKDHSEIEGLVVMEMLLGASQELDNAIHSLQCG